MESQEKMHTNTEEAKVIDLNANIKNSEETLLTFEQQRAEDLDSLSITEAQLKTETNPEEIERLNKYSMKLRHRLGMDENIAA